jgi:hypothetical protein
MLRTVTDPTSEITPIDRVRAAHQLLGHVLDGTASRFVDDASQLVDAAIQLLEQASGRA